MNQLQLYPEALAVYILLGIVMLFLLDYKLRKRAFILRVGLLSLVGVLAFTPEMVMNAENYAPKVVMSVLNIEKLGITALTEGLITLAIIWGIVFFSILAVRHWLLGRRKVTAVVEESEGE
jgi:hypothetical protein